MSLSTTLGRYTTPKNSLTFGSVCATKAFQIPFSLLPTRVAECVCAFPPPPAFPSSDLASTSLLRLLRTRGGISGRRRATIEAVVATHCLLRCEREGGADSISQPSSPGGNALLVLQHYSFCERSASWRIRYNAFQVSRQSSIQRQYQSRKAPPLLVRKQTLPSNNVRALIHSTYYTYRV